MMTYDEIRKDPEVLALLQKGNENLGAMGFTDHSIAHCTLVAERAAHILKVLGYPEREQELAAIAGVMHDIGNAVNRHNHAITGALLACSILEDRDMAREDRMTVITAIGNHDESTGGARDPVSAAVILADKSDVRRNRVRPKAPERFDIHDRVNYAVTGSSLRTDRENMRISLDLQIDQDMCTMYEYFEIFLGRMMMCRGAAEVLGSEFRLTVNGGRVL